MSRVAGGTTSLSSAQGPSEENRQRVLKAHAAVPLAAPQARATAAGARGRLFGRQDLALQIAIFEEPTDASTAEVASVASAEGQPSDAGEGNNPGVAMRPTLDDAYAQALLRRAEAVLAEADELAAKRLADAEAQVDEMLQAAVAASEQITSAAREQAYQEGHSAGYHDGLSAAHAEAQSIVEQGQAERSRLLAEAAPEMVRLALAVAEHILHQEVQVRPELVAGMVAAALAECVGERHLVLRVAPRDADRLGARKGELMRRVPGLQELDVVADGSLSPGDFHLQGEHGYVSAALGEQLAIVAAALLQEEPS